MDRAPEIESALKTIFGYSELREGQEEVISALLAHRSALAIFPTGGGKSLCYQIPAVVMEGTALIVSPLLALMKDQVDGLVKKGVAAARVDSTLSHEQYAEVINKLHAGELKLLYVSPEKLGNPEFQKLLKNVLISFAAVDEAHCISEWGHNFRPDYLKLSKVFRKLKIGTLLALTATATPQVSADIRKRFRIAKNDHVQLSFHRENLYLAIAPCTPKEKKPLLLEKLHETQGPAIVYVTRQETAEEVATFLAKSGLSCRAYHAGLRNELRREIQEDFMSGKTEIVVATIAFGMGVDKSNIRRVIHYNLPKSLEGYTQEIGRAGRDGDSATCTLLASPQDRVVLENFNYSDTPGEQAIENLLTRIFRLGEHFDVSFYDLSVTADIRQTVIEIIFARLELAGIFRSGEVFWENYRLKLLQPLDKLLTGRPTGEKRQIKALFDPLDAEWKWLTVAIPEASARLGISPKKLRSLIIELESAGEVQAKPSGWRRSFTRRPDAPDLREIIMEMTSFFQSRELSDLTRLDEVITFANSRKCLTAVLLKHFGETLREPCGHCDRCSDIHPTPLTRADSRTITSSESEVIQHLVKEKLPALGSSRQLARFLCGMSSPAAMRARLYRKDEYGMLADLAFDDVLAIAQSHH